MLHEITWKDYWTFIAIATAIYWFIIISFFYKAEILAIAKGKKKSDFLPVKQTASPEDGSNIKLSSNEQPSLFHENEIIDNTQFGHGETHYNEDDDFEEINLTPDAHALAIEIKEQIAAAQEKKLVKEELLFSLQQIIKTYTQLKGTAFQKDINNLVITECETLCSIHLSAEELKMLWVS